MKAFTKMRVFSLVFVAFIVASLVSFAGCAPDQSSSLATSSASAEQVDSGSSAAAANASSAQENESAKETASSAETTSEETATLSSSEQPLNEVTEALFEVSDFDARCLGCHGGTYEAVAELTSDLGIWNPHDSFHGGYNSCENCHNENMEVNYNYCSQCHAYAPTEDGLFLDDPWV